MKVPPSKRLLIDGAAPFTRVPAAEPLLLGRVPDSYHSVLDWTRAPRASVLLPLATRPPPSNLRRRSDSRAVRLPLVGCTHSVARSYCHF
jgi:hypothetical protein